MVTRKRKKQRHPFIAKSKDEVRSLVSEVRLETEIFRGFGTCPICGNRRKLVDDVSFNVRKGEVLGIAGLMGIGAVFGAILTMYTAVATRAREIATLRALGFNTMSVLVSILAESLVLGAIGGVIGGAAAYLAFNGYQTSTMNFQTFSQVAFAFRVTPELLGMGLFYALAMGLVGGLLPAIRAARLPIPTALREL